MKAAELITLKSEKIYIRVFKDTKIKKHNNNSNQINGESHWQT